MLQQHDRACKDGIMAKFIKDLDGVGCWFGMAKALAVSRMQSLDLDIVDRISVLGFPIEDVFKGPCSSVPKKEFSFILETNHSVLLISGEQVLQSEGRLFPLGITCFWRVGGRKEAADQTFFIERLRI